MHFLKKDNDVFSKEVYNLKFFAYILNYPGMTTSVFCSPLLLAVSVFDIRERSGELIMLF